MPTRRDASLPPVPGLPALPPAESLQAELRQALPGWASVAWREHSGSTNAELLAALKAGQECPALLGAHWQTSGRGRAGRSFVTPPSSALTFSCGFTTTLPPAALPTLSIWLGLAAWTALAGLLPAGHALCLKWPNDLQWGAAKLAGILLESTGLRAGQPVGLVIGIGINLAPGAQLSGLLQREVAGWFDTGGGGTPSTLVSRIAQYWWDALRRAEQDWRAGTGLASLPDEFARADALANRPIRLLDQGVEQANGLAQGVDGHGRLGLLAEDGLQWLTVGDVSVRPLP